MSNETKNPILSLSNPHNRKKLWRNIFLNPKNKAVIIFFTLDVLIYNISLSIYNAGLRSQYDLTYGQLALLSISFSVSSIVFQIPGGHLPDKIVMPYFNYRGLINNRWLALSGALTSLNKTMTCRSDHDTFPIPCGRSTFSTHRLRGASRMTGVVHLLPVCTVFFSKVEHCPNVFRLCLIYGTSGGYDETSPLADDINQFPAIVFDILQRTCLQ